VASLGDEGRGERTAPGDTIKGADGSGEETTAKEVITFQRRAMTKKVVNFFQEKQGDTISCRPE